MSKKTNIKIENPVSTTINHNKMLRGRGPAACAIFGW
jgi:hypothetical protein